MKIGEVCNCSVVTVDRESSVLSAAKVMRKFHVGDVVIVEQRGTDPVPVGILTDRDIVLEVLALEVSPDSLRVDDVYTSDNLVTAQIDDTVETVLERMRTHGIRRIPIVNSKGALKGIFTMDDSLGLIAEHFKRIVQLMDNQRQREDRLRA